MNPTAGGASLLPLVNCDGVTRVDGNGPPAAGYAGRWTDAVNVMRLVDGFVVGLDSVSTKNGSTRISLEEAKRNLDLLSY